jgi:hypothetical protein
MRRSLEQAERHAIPVKVLSSWYDIDDSESLDWLLAELRGDKPPGHVHEGRKRRRPARRSVLMRERSGVAAAMALVLLALALFNPYLHVPADPALSALRDPEQYGLIDKRDYAVTIYPPVAEVIFALITRISTTLPR